MEFPEKSLKATIPVKAPVMSSSKPEKEERKEDGKEDNKEEGCTTPMGKEHRIPPQLECPPAPRRGTYRGRIEKRREKSAGQRSISFNVQELDTFFARIHVADDS
ncbi:PREDICTED: cyclin-dependent protein kinase inhibitor SMR1-like [Camelina sativa]|uniref:Cyclin-dependent protein kinase inhibitor SMR1-like n=1 Tax=Camelina sativa TaxID=90675 RepID=A0ABM0TKR7_CAMSA|nr:PREDICTED: cyclin-dependent protein kinase inhibitor SMR1-like [Camelina sativa]